MSDTTKRILDYIKQITSDDFNHIEQNIKYIKEQIQSAIRRIDRLNNENKNPIRNDTTKRNDPTKCLQKIKETFDNIHKENIIDNIKTHMQNLEYDYTLYKIKKMNNSYHGSLSGPLTFYNVNIDNIIKTFNKIKEEIFKINNNITRERLIKIEYVNNNNAKISYESLYRIETCINQLETNQKTKLANYLYFLSYINNIDKEVTFDLKDLEIVCNWLQDKSKDEYLKNNLIQQYNKDIKLRDNLIEIQLILKKRETPNPKEKTSKPHHKDNNS